MNDCYVRERTELAKQMLAVRSTEKNREKGEKQYTRRKSSTEKGYERETERDDPIINNHRVY